MTKRELLEALKDVPDGALVMRFDTGDGFREVREVATHATAYQQDPAFDWIVYPSLGIAYVCEAPAVLLR